MRRTRSTGCSPAPAQAPYTEAQIKAARDAFGQQMRAALQSAYSVDTIVQYDVAWNGAVPADADGAIELFGQVEATVSGTYACNGTTVTATASRRTTSRRRTAY